MQVINKNPAFSPQAWTPPLLSPLEAWWQGFIYRQLNQAYSTAKTIPFNNQDRLIFLSDSHRGDGGGSDVFKPNKSLFLHALKAYFDQGFTYVEVGDGDELWKYPNFKRIRQAHQDVFDLLHRFNRERRLHIITGNHDVRRPEEMETERDGLLSREALLFEHSESHQKLFVVHGHQVDISSSRMHHISQWSVELFLPMLHRLGVISKVAKEKPESCMPNDFFSWFKSLKPNTCQVEQRLMQWASQNRQITICGHTHVQQFPRNRAVPYINTGSCLYDRYITGLELIGGRLQMIKWKAQEIQGRVQFLREPMSSVWDLNEKLKME